MHLGTGFAPVHRTRACKFAPFLARTCVESSTTRDRSSSPRRRGVAPGVAGGPRVRPATRSGIGGARSTSTLRNTVAGHARRPQTLEGPRPRAHQPEPRHPPAPRTPRDHPETIFTLNEVDRKRSLPGPDGSKLAAPKPAAASRSSMGTEYAHSTVRPDASTTAFPRRALIPAPATRWAGSTSTSTLPISTTMPWHLAAGPD